MEFKKGDDVICMAIPIAPFIGTIESKKVGGECVLIGRYPTVPGIYGELIEVEEEDLIPYSLPNWREVIRFGKFSHAQREVAVLS
jgi:hypothetical protein